MNKDKVICCGFSCETREGWKDFTPSPAAPSNYKDPAKISDYVDKALLKQEITAGGKPLTGQITFVETCGYALAESLTYDSGVEFYKELTSVVCSPPFGDTIAVFGLRIHHRMHLCALSIAENDNCPVNLWGLYARNDLMRLPSDLRLVDPVRIVMGENDDKAVEALLMYVEKNNNTKYNLALADQQALFVEAVVKRFKLNLLLY